MTVRLREINLHPVKSTAIRPVERAYVGRAGLRGDREWMVVDDAGMLVTARDTPRLFTVVADNAATGPAPGLGPGADLRLSAPGLDPVEVAVPAQEGTEIDVRFFGGALRARPVGSTADAWLRKALGRDDLRLVWCHEPEARVLDEPGLEREHAVFQDDSPVSLLSDTSVSELAGWAGEPIPARRFRANLLVEGVDAAFAEDGWSTLTVGGARLRVAVPIARCSMTAIDPDTLTTGKEPVRTLARHRKWGGKTWMAVHLAVEQPGEIAVGDEVAVE